MHKPVETHKAFLTGAFEACELKAATETTSNRSQTPQQSSYQTHSTTSSTNYHTYTYVKSGKKSQTIKTLPPLSKFSQPCVTSTKLSACFGCGNFILSLPPFGQGEGISHLALNSQTRPQQPPFTKSKQNVSLPPPSSLQTKPCQDEYLKVEPRLPIGPSERSAMSTDNQTHTNPP